MSKASLAGLFALPLLALAQAQPVISIVSMPANPIVETRDKNNYINFDMVVKNESNMMLRIAKLEVSIFDADHALVQRRAINTDAFAPSIAVIGQRLIAPRESLDVFNPFPAFEAQVPLNRLEFSFCLQRETNANERETNLHRLPDDCDYQVSTVVAPRFYDTKTPLVLPLKGKVLVWEGHDSYAHHFRIPFSNPKVKALGILADSNNFAADFVYTDDEGRYYRGDPRRIDNWYGYGKPIYAPGAGTVIAAASDISDNWFIDQRATKIGYPKVPAGKDPNDIGNFVLIDHGDGEYSLLLHMKPGSVRVKVGERVAAGREVGQIGFSGDSIFPHLHYSLLGGPHVTKDWGIPAYFSHFRRRYGAKSVEVARGPVNSGDFVERE